MPVQAPSTGEVALIVPTVDIRAMGETHMIDGVPIEFQLAPATEAPAEMHFYFPQLRALCMAENAAHNLHNLLTCAERWCVTRTPGRDISPRRSICSPPTTGQPGDMSA